MRSILVASTSEEAARELHNLLGKNYRVDIAPDRAACLDMFRRRRYEFTLIDTNILRGNVPEGSRPNYKAALQPFWQAYSNAHIIVLSTQEQIRDAVEAVKAGASNYLTYPVSSSEVHYVLENLSEFQKIEFELELRREEVLGASLEEGARTNSPLMREVLRKIRSVAPTRTTVVLTGETGSGKGVLARLLHALSNRADGPFIAFHCGAIPDTLLESEFFGHEKGAFTGAVRRKLGKFQIADGGTLFLDEIGTITPAAQIKMLQVLQDRTFTRVGGEETIEVDIRLVAATNMNLEKLTKEGLFREDLYFRLNVFPIEVPPLRNRTEDIPVLVETFIERLNRTGNKNIKGVEVEVKDMLMRYSWPGNIRELENLVERAYILEKGSLLSAESFPSEMFTMEPLGTGVGSDHLPNLDEVRHLALEKVERRYLKEVLTLKKGRIDATAEVAGITTRQLHNLMSRYGLYKEDFK